MGRIEGRNRRASRTPLNLAQKTNQLLFSAHHAKVKEQAVSLHIFRRNATHCISPYDIVAYVCVCVCVCVCVSVCVSVCVCRVCGRQENGLR